MIVFAIRYLSKRYQKTLSGEYEWINYWVWYSGNGYGIAQMYDTKGKATGIAKRIGRDIAYEVIEVVLPEHPEIVK